MLPAGLATVLVVMAAAASCQPAWTIHGQVVRRAAASVAPAPLPGAEVTLRCDDGPGGAPLEQTVRADEQGGFYLDGPGTGPRLDCELRVAMDGFGPRAYTVDNACADADEAEAVERCSAAALQAELEPLARQ
jgi:hypothetical protein